MSAFSGSDGKVSMMRLTSFIVVVVIMGVFLAHNIVSMVNGLGFVGIGFEEASLIAASLGAKAFQTYSEVKANRNTPPTTNDIPSDKTQ